MTPGGDGTAVCVPSRSPRRRPPPSRNDLAPCSPRCPRSPRRGTRPPPRGSPGGPPRQAASPATPAFGGVGRTDGPPLPVSLVAVALSAEPPAWGAESGQRSNAHVVMKFTTAGDTNSPGASRQLNLYHDLASGVRDDRPGLDSCLRALRKGDVLVVWKLDRLGRNLAHLVNTVQDLSARGVGLGVLGGAPPTSGLTPGRRLRRVAARSGRRGSIIGRRLDDIHTRLCQKVPGLPWLVAIAVSKTTGLPSEGLLARRGKNIELKNPNDRAWWRAMVLHVFATDWSRIEP